jgi:hypothetical protein
MADEDWREQTVVEGSGVNRAISASRATSTGLSVAD